MWPWSAKKISDEEKAAQTLDANAAMLETLQTRFETNAAVIGKYEANVRRLSEEANKAPSRAKKDEFMAQAQRAFKTMNMMKKDQQTLSGQIDMLMGLTNNVHAMHLNVELHGRVKDSNTVTSRIAGQLDVDEVHNTMDAVHEHSRQHDEVSEALAGGATLMDPDDMAAEMAAFLGESEPRMHVAAAVPSTEAATLGRIQREELELEQLMASTAKVPTTRVAAAAQRK